MVGSQGLFSAWQDISNPLVAEQLGIAWSPTSKWTVRTGAGIFYSQDTGNPRFDMERNFGGRLRDNTSADNPLTFERPFVATGVTVSRPYVLGNIHDRRTPMIEQYMLNMQRELDSKTVLEIGYLGSTPRSPDICDGLRRVR